MFVFTVRLDMGWIWFDVFACVDGAVDDALGLEEGEPGMNISFELE